MGINVWGVQSTEQMQVHVRIVFTIILTIAVLQGCGGKALGNDPNTTASAKQHCNQVANKYIADNYIGLDPLWRDQERYKQYRICMAKQQ